MNNVEETLRRLKLKVTPIRLAILDVFSCDCEPINAEQIYKKLKAQKINIVTVYRTLATFKNVGILNGVDLQKGSEYYELAGHHHHHIVCTDCGLTESFDGCDLDTLSKKILRKSSQFDTISRHSFELFGLCKNCRTCQ